MSIAQEKMAVRPLSSDNLHRTIRQFPFIADDTFYGAHMIESPELLLTSNINEFFGQLIQIPVVMHITVNGQPRAFNTCIFLINDRPVPVQYRLINGKPLAAKAPIAAS